MLKRYFVGHSSAGGGPVMGEFIVGELYEREQHEYAPKPRCDEHGVFYLKGPVIFVRMAMLVNNQPNFQTTPTEDELFPMDKEMVVGCNIAQFANYRIANEDDLAVKLYIQAYATKAGLEIPNNPKNPFFSK